MNHYLHHLFFDPLGMFDSAVRDLFVFCLILGGLGFIIFISTLANLVLEDRNAPK